jgi:aspartyl-tRNA(Asn)/glutamyl-tRNA(Gln) amidotransferase subunit A
MATLTIVDSWVSLYDCVLSRQRRNLHAIGKSKIENRNPTMIPTIHAAAEDIRQGRLSPPELLDACLRQIDALEERVRAWVFVDRDGARAQALRCADEIRRGQWRGPLHGIPIGVKDIFDVFDWPTACGSRLWANSIARHDATVVQHLRAAGAILLGKTVTTQYASFDPPVTRNPWDPARTPGGSSSGSAAALACGMCPGALGSQTGGSITRPAAYCGVAGCKPTHGRVSGAGVLPLAPSIDHPGPMAGCVRDLAILLQVLAGPDPCDPLCSPQPVPDYVAAVAGSRRPPRLGRLRGLFEERAEPSVHALVDGTARRFQERGAAVVDVALPAAFAEVIPRHRVVMAVEGMQFHEERLRRHPDDYGPKIRSLLEEARSCSAAEYARCKDHQRELTTAMRSCFAGVDALLTPATPGPAPDAATTGDPAFNSPWSYTGLPTVSFLAGWTAGLPLALQLVGPAWGEADLLPAAVWCEEALAVQRREPVR